MPSHVRFDPDAWLRSKSRNTATFDLILTSRYTRNPETLELSRLPSSLDNSASTCYIAR